jgi:hypothetical protein
MVPLAVPTGLDESFDKSGQKFATNVVGERADNKNHNHGCDMLVKPSSKQVPYTIVGLQPDL